MEELENDLLAAMYKSYFNDDSRYDTAVWIKEQMAIIQQDKDKKPEDREKFYMALKQLLDKMVDKGVIARKIGSYCLITPSGITYCETTPGVVDEAIKRKIQIRRRDILQAISVIISESPQGQAQFGKVMEKTRLARHDCSAHMKLAEERGSIEGAAAGFFRLTDMGQYELQALNEMYPPEGAKKKEDQPTSGPVNLMSIKFFD